MSSVDSAASPVQVAVRLLTVVIPLALSLASMPAASQTTGETPQSRAQTRDVYLERANRALQDRNYRQAQEVISQGMELFPNDAALDALASLVRVQTREEQRRLVERGLETFFDSPGVSCRAWMRLLQIDPDDQNATKNVEALSKRLEEDLNRLELAAERSIEAGDWSIAMRFATELGELECLYKRSTPLIERIDSAYREAVQTTLDTVTQQVMSADCQGHRQILDELAGETLLSRQQTARTYLLIATCDQRAGDLESARISLTNALSFDPDLHVPEWLDPDTQELLRQLLATP